MKGIGFEGGFIGVDIFFVISGYLITRIIFSELQTKGSFNFPNFYERRARRILPMLFVVIFASMPYAWQKLLPSAFVEYAESILASLFFGSNFFFYFSTTEYGADSALLKPFLHTWSLGVEEQFYLVFPIISIIGFKFFRKHFLSVLVLLSLLSLHFAELMQAKNSDLNFYMPFSRFWELAVGSILAYWELNYKVSKKGIVVRVLPVLGLYLVAYSILFFDSKTPHPSLHTLIPILGVALIICFASQDELVGRILGSKPFIWLGLISYSAYLWHFPIFAFSRIGQQATNFDKVEWIAITFTLSVLSYFLVEKPFRDRTLIKPFSFLMGMLGSLIVVCVGAYFVISNDGYSKRMTKAVGFPNFELDNKKLRDQSWTLLKKRRKENPHFLSVEKKVLLFGNSHARDLFNALVQNGYPNSSTDILVASHQIACTQIRKIDKAKTYKQATTIVIATWYLKERKCKKYNNEIFVSSDLEGLRYLIKKAKSDGKNVIVMSNTAEFGEINDMMVEDYLYKLHKNRDLAYKFEAIKFEAERLLWAKLTKAIKVNSEISHIADKLGASYFDKVQLICDDDKRVCSAFTHDGFKTRYDGNHWTLEGAKFFGKRLLQKGFASILY